jgi:hypothetical protein
VSSEVDCYRKDKESETDGAADYAMLITIPVKQKKNTQVWTVAVVASAWGL